MSFDKFVMVISGQQWHLMMVNLKWLCFPISRWPCYSKITMIHFSNGIVIAKFISKIFQWHHYSKFTQNCRCKVSITKLLLQIPNCNFFKHTEPSCCTMLKKFLFFFKDACFKFVGTLFLHSLYFSTLRLLTGVPNMRLPGTIGSLRTL